MAQALAEAGANVVVTSRQEDRAMKSAATLATITGKRTLGIAADITDAEQIESMIQSVVNEFGRIDILVNNVGINIRKPVEELDSPYEGAALRQDNQSLFHDGPDSITREKCLLLQQRWSHPVNQGTGAGMGHA